MHPVEKGEFEITGLAPGEYKVTAVLFAGGKTRTATQTVNVVAADVDDVSLVLTPTGLGAVELRIIRRVVGGRYGKNSRR